MSGLRATIVLIISFVLFFVWQLTDHLAFMNNLMAMEHLRSLLVGTAIALLTVAYAASELFRQYRRLKELEEAKDDLTSMIIHDLRTPLTSMIGSMQTAQAGAFGQLNPELAEFVDISVKSGERMLRMVNNILDISKMEAEMVKLDLETTTLSDLAESALVEVRYLVHEKDLKISVTTDPENLSVKCDVEKIRRVIINLLGNAIKFTPQGGSISLLATKNSSAVTVSVTDTGEGIPSEFREKIFDKFGQVESQKANRRRSTGLGLTFCKLAVEAHGGRIWVDSTPGVGSSFHFTLPHHK